MKNHLRLVFDSIRDIRCACLTLVVKNESLEEKYEGGLAAFLDKYAWRCNRHITVSCSMGDDIDEIINELLASGLEVKKDFWVFDASNYALGYCNMPETKDKLVPIDVNVRWLKLHYLKGIIFARYVDPKNKYYKGKISETIAP